MRNLYFTDNSGEISYEQAKSRVFHGPFPLSNIGLFGLFVCLTYGARKLVGTGCAFAAAFVAAESVGDVIYRLSLAEL